MVKVPELGFNGKKLKPLVTQSIIRIQMIKQKRTANIERQKKGVASMLGNGQIEKARLETERIIKADWMVEAMDLCELFCETVRDNAQVIAAEKRCPTDLEEAVITLIYCAHRTEVKELTAVVKQLKKKYGGEFIDLAQNNRGKIVNDRIVHKLSGQRPNAFLVVTYMKELSAMYGVGWVPSAEDEELGQRFDTPMRSPVGSGQNRGGASGLGGGAYAITDGKILRPGQVPAGYVPPDPKLDTIIPLDETKNDDDDDENGGGGGQTELLTAEIVEEREEDGVQGHSVRGNEQIQKSKPQPKKEQVKSKAQKEKDKIDALQARFDKLRKN